MSNFLCDVFMAGLLLDDAYVKLAGWLAVYIHELRCPTEWESHGVCMERVCV